MRLRPVRREAATTRESSDDDSLAPASRHPSVPPGRPPGLGIVPHVFEMVIEPLEVVCEGDSYLVDDAVRD